MPIKALNHIRQKASKMAYNSALYNWSLNGAVPERLIVKPVDVWQGLSDTGRILCNGAFVLDGQPLNFNEDCWHPVGVTEVWLMHMHGFTWLRDLKACGGNDARMRGRELILNWIKHHKGWHETAWRADITGQRLAMWMSHYETFGASADEEFQDVFFESLIRQARHLSRSLPGDLSGVALLQALRGLLFAGLGFEGRESWIEQALDVLSREIDVQILKDGGHISRSPQQLLQALQILLEVRVGMGLSGYPLPEKVQHAIDRMAPALRFFRYADKGFALFHGAQEGDIALMDAVLQQANARGKALQSLPCTGFEKITQGRSTLMIDVGGAPDSPFDAHAHAAPLAIEFCYGKERLFVACGDHTMSDEWRDALRATPAHSSLCLDHRNAGEISQEGHFGRRPRKIVSVREDCKGACLVEASHDGYVSLNGITHKRRLFLSQQGHDLRGEDSLSCSIGLARSHEVAIRFHIHPRVTVSLVREGAEALLRLSSGAGFRFQCDSGLLQLENSVYFGLGNQPRKTKQLVIYGQMDCDLVQIKWALRRE